VTPGLVTGSFLIMLSMVGGAPLPTNTDNRGVTTKVSPEELFTLVQTQGMNRRGDRRDTKQDCRQQEGVVGSDKRGCKQEGRQQRNNPAPASNANPQAPSGNPQTPSR
jgi:hypothetical protein